MIRRAPNPLGGSVPATAAQRPGHRRSETPCDRASAGAGPPPPRGAPSRGRGRHPRRYGETLDRELPRRHRNLAGEPSRLEPGSARQAPRLAAGFTSRSRRRVRRARPRRAKEHERAVADRALHDGGLRAARADEAMQSSPMRGPAGCQVERRAGPAAPEDSGRSASASRAPRARRGGRSLGALLLLRNCSISSTSSEAGGRSLASRRAPPRPHGTRACGIAGDSSRSARRSGEFLVELASGVLEVAQVHRRVSSRSTRPHERQRGLGVLDPRD